MEGCLWLVKWFLNTSFTLNLSWRGLLRMAGHTAASAVHVFTEVCPFPRPMFPTCAWQMPKLKPAPSRLALPAAFQCTLPLWLDAWQRVFLLPWELWVCSYFLTVGSWIIVRNSLSSISKCAEMAWCAILCLRGVVLFGKNMHLGALTHVLVKVKALTGF